MIEFVLHRLKIERRFVPFSIHAEDDFTSAQVISSAINENLARTLRARRTWRIGNVEDIDGNLFSCPGKSKRYDRDKFNEENNQFFHGLERKHLIRLSQLTQNFRFAVSRKILRWRHEFPGYQKILPNYLI